jgi:hypothetical protein
MDISLGILGNETTFEYALIDYGYQLQGTVHTTPSGAKRVQYAKEDKYLFNIKLTYVTDEVWDDLMIEVNNSKENDLNLIIGEDNYTVRIVPETIPKKPIIGTAEGYDISFNLIEV